MYLAMNGLEPDGLSALLQRHGLNNLYALDPLHMEQWKV